jgi:hypothetical protein
VKVTEQTIRAVLKRWRPRLGLDDRWHLEVRLYTDETWPKKWRGSVAVIEPSPGYSSAVLHANTDALERDNDTLERNILHELVHVPLWRLSIIARDALGASQEAIWRDLMEEATECMTRALLSPPGSK